jgi:hypothetical protein
MSKLSFEQALSKGSIGEAIVREFLQEEGYVVYEPVRGEPHPFDKVAVKDKSKLYLIEVKTKQSTELGEYGINNSSLTTYKYIAKEYTLPMLVFFVDYNPSVKELRYTSLSNLLVAIEFNNKRYPYIISNDQMNITMFNKHSTKLIRSLTEEEYNLIVELL